MGHFWQEQALASKECFSGKIIISYLEESITPFPKHTKPMWEEDLVLKAGSTLRRVLVCTHGWFRAGIQSKLFSAVGCTASCAPLETGASSRSCLRLWTWKHFVHHNIAVWMWVIVKVSKLKASACLRHIFPWDAECGFLASLDRSLYLCPRTL